MFTVSVSAWGVFALGVITGIVLSAIGLVIAAVAVNKKSK